ncbi:MAG: hypothetical protein IMF06_03615, partial [Proteobacteria bacterium]|nr:hypothetical protein [Pseudomonadota bacterium]
MPGRLELPIIRAGEVLSYVAGILFLGFFVVQIAQGEIQRRSDIAEFTPPSEVSLVPIPNVGAPNTALWAPGRVSDY